MIAILVVLGIILVVFGFIHTFQMTSFAIQLADTQTSWFGDWMNIGNFWAWVVGFIAILISFALIRLVARIAWSILAVIFGAIGAVMTNFMNPTDSHNRNYSNGAMGGVTFVLVMRLIVAIVASLLITIWFFDFASNYPELTDWFHKDNWIAMGFMFTTFAGLVSGAKESND